MTYQLCDAFLFVRVLFTKSFPYRENREGYSLNGVKVSCGPWRFALDAVLLQIDVESPVHAFY